MNKVILIGRLTKKPELKTTYSGLSTCSFTLAVNRAFKDKDGNIQTDFINCVAWRSTAETLVAYMDKGSQIAICGEIQTRTYEDTSAKKVYVTEVVCSNIEFLSGSKAKDGYENIPGIPDFPKKVSSGNNNAVINAPFVDEAHDDDLPF